MTAIRMMNPLEAETFMKQHNSDAFTLLDVRQEWEYEEAHIPGALLLPLPELPAKGASLSRDKALIIYCRSGARSLAAASLLENYEFENIYNIIGGMAAWQGENAHGPAELGLFLFDATDSPRTILLKAFSLEHQLELFYTRNAGKQQNPSIRQTLLQLAGYEDKHKKTLHRIARKLNSEEVSYDDFAVEALALDLGALEGGIDMDDLMRQYGVRAGDEAGLVQFAMAVEAQAFDFYTRCGRKSTVSEAVELFDIMAREENAHLAILAKFMDSLGDGRRGGVP